MRNVFLSLFLMTFLVGNAFAAKKTMMKTPTFFTPDEIKWTTDEKSGVSMAVQWGDPKKGPFAGLAKFPKGWTAPLHHHTADHVVYLISGTFTITEENGKEWRLTPGMTGTLPGKVKHTTKCAEEADCMLFAYLSAKDDMIPAAELSKKTN